MNYDDWKTDPEIDRKEEIQEEDPDQAMDRKQERELMEREEREGRW